MLGASSLAIIGACGVADVVCVKIYLCVSVQKIRA